jgi:ectoine hydroxylase-related dioxygenase (phytanoyl-CoA dioxygenase family)
LEDEKGVFVTVSALEQETKSMPRGDVFPEQTIALSKEEQASGVLSEENRRLAGLILSCRGYVIFKDALPRDFIDMVAKEVATIYQDCRTTANSETDTDAEAYHSVRESAVKRAAFWYRKSRWRIFPKLVPPMGDPLLLANPFVTPVLEDLLGEDFYCKYVSSDTCVKGAILQSPHSDIDGNEVMVDNRWRPRGYIVNVPVMECGLHNGPIEVWPGGSHMWTSDLMKKYGLSPDVQDGRNPPVERVAEYFASVKLSLSPGEIMIRDLAMWHRGTPNPTDHPRTMLTTAYFRRSHKYLYGDPSFNLDREMYRNLHPRIQRMFDYHFSLSNSLRRQQKRLRQAVRAKATEWIKGRP